MYKRDVAILLLSCFAILISLQREGSFSFQKAWYHSISHDIEDLFGGLQTLPAPVVADLNGDGSLEVILTTPDLKLQVIRPQPAGHRGEGFAAAHIINEVSLLYGRVSIPAVRRPVALRVGYIDPPPRERVRSPRQQIIVIVTAAWHVLAYDHNLKLLWEQSVHEGFPTHSHLKEVVIHISPHQVNKGDRGMVVVGGSATRRHIAPDGLEFDGPAYGGDSDVFRRQMRDEEMELQHRKSAGDKEANADVGNVDVDTSRHFSYTAFEAGTGAQRWQHQPADFHRSLETDAAELRPQNDYKLEAQLIESRKYGELSCRDYRESVVHVLPHVWKRASDSRMEEAHFVRHREGKGADKGALGNTGAAVRGTPGQSFKTSMISRLLGLTATSSLAAGATHGSTHATSSSSGSRSKHTNVTANALVAYLEEGIEVLHLFTGRTLCKLHLPAGQVHADVNGDAVVDHIQVHEGDVAGDEREGSGAVNVHTQAGFGSPNRCRARARSGIPARDHLFETAVCRTRGGRGSRGSAALRQQTAATAHMPIEVLAPAVLPLPRQYGGYGDRSHRRSLLAFLTNFGEVTALGPLGEHLWHNFYPATWPANSAEETLVVPGITSLALRRHAYPTALLAVGTASAVVISEHGNTLETLRLPSPPIAPIVVDDFTGDGFNDIIVVTSMGLYGYAQVPHLGGFALSGILLTLIVAMGVVYYTQQLSSAPILGERQGRKLRSTDYVD